MVHCYMGGIPDGGGAYLKAVYMKELRSVKDQIFCNSDKSRIKTI